MSGTATMADFADQMREWRDLSQELRERQEAELWCELFENGQLVPGRIDEWERARATTEGVRQRMRAMAETFRNT